MSKLSRTTWRRGMLGLCFVLGLVFSTALYAATWNNPAGGSWAAPANWDAIPNAVDAVADFSTLNLTANATVTLDGNFKVGTLNFGDTTPSNNWTVSAGTPAGVLTLDVTTGTSIINVVNQTATISAVVAGNDGITKNGAGVLVLNGANTFTGGLNISAGSVRLATSGTAGGVGSPITVNPGTNLIGTTNNAFSTPVILAGGTLGSSVTASTWSGGVNVTANSTVYNADPLALGTNGENIITGVLSGSGNINLLAGTSNTNPDGGVGFRLRGTAASTYSGTITVGQNTKFELQTSVAGPFAPGGTGTIVMTAGNANFGNTVNAPGSGGYSEINLRNNSGGSTTLGNNVQVVGTGNVTLNVIGTAPVGAATNMGKMTVGNQEVTIYSASGSNAHVVAFSSVSLTGSPTFSPFSTRFGATNQAGGDLSLSNISETIPGQSITMAGLRTLFLGGNNSFTGGVTINSGIVQMSSSGALNAATPQVVTFAANAPANTTLRLAGNSVTAGGIVSDPANPGTPVIENANVTPATLTVNSAANSTFGGVVQNGTGTGALSLAKKGSGTFTLSGTNTYTGITTINGGTLALVTASSNNIPASTSIGVDSTGKLDVTGVASGFSVSTPQTLTNNGNVVGDVNVSGGGNVNGVGTFANNLLMQSGGNELVRINGATSDKIIVTGTADFTGGGTVGVTLLSAATQPFYDVLVAGNLLGTPTLSNTTVGRTSFSLAASHPANTIRINVTGGPANVRWTGADTAHDPTNWDNLQSAANWTTADAVTDKTHFYDFDNVTFNDTNNNQYNINIVGTVSPGSITVDNSSGDYVFGGGGTIAGLGGITKSGASALTFSTANTYAGNTTLNAGTLNINNATALGAGMLAINGGAIDNTSGSDNTLTNNNPIVLAANFGFTGTGNLNLGTGPVTLNANPTITAAGNTLTIGGIISNGTGNALTKAGAGTLTLSGANTFTGGITVNTGTLRLNNAAAGGTGAALVNTGATLVAGGNLANAVTLAGGTFGASTAWVVSMAILLPRPPRPRPFTLLIHRTCS